MSKRSKLGDHVIIFWYVWVIRRWHCTVLGFLCSLGFLGYFALCRHFSLKPFTKALAQLYVALFEMYIDWSVRVVLRNADILIFWIVCFVVWMVMMKLKWLPLSWASPLLVLCCKNQSLDFGCEINNSCWSVTICKAFVPKRLFLWLWETFSTLCIASQTVNSQQNKCLFHTDLLTSSWLVVKLASSHSIISSSV